MIFNLLMQNNIKKVWGDIIISMLMMIMISKDICISDYHHQYAISTEIYIKELFNAFNNTTHNNKQHVESTHTRIQHLIFF
jgi:hypothetical protein